MRTFQQVLFTPQTEWVVPEELKDLRGHKEIAVDLETCDPDLTELGSGNVIGRGKIVGVAVAVEGWSAYYPIAHEGGGNMDKKLVLNWVQDLFKQDATFIFHNAMYDVSWLRSTGLTLPKDIRDTMIAASLVDENRLSYRLDTLAKEYAGIGKDEAVLQAAAKEYGINPKKDLWKLPSMFVGQYAERDAESTLKLWHEMKVEINKAHTTFIDTITKHSHNGRIHADINQIRSDDGGTVTGRFSMSNPNLQQIPVRHKELGPLIRSIFIPEENCKWGVFDYSQQEPRILVHYAKLQKLDGIDEIANAYISGEADFHAAVAKMAGIERSQAKTINLGLMYGMGKNKLMAELGLMKEAAEKLIAQYHAKAPFIKQLMKSTTNKAERSGVIRTLKGRICHFDMWEPLTFNTGTPKKLEDAQKEYTFGIKRAFTYRALNRLIQGSAADMTKMSLIRLHEEGIIPHIQIHDEVDISVESPEHASKIIEIMESAVKLEIPNKVDYESGDNWGDIK